MPVLTTKVTLHNHIQQVVPLSDDEFADVRSYFGQRSFKKHQYLLQANEPDTNEFFVLSGLLKSSYIDQAGKIHILQFAMEDWWISDFTAFNLQTLATLSIDCIEDTEVLFITYHNKEELCKAHQKMEYFFRKKYALGNAALQRRLLFLLAANPTERYKNLLQQYPDLYRRVPKSLLAAYLGVSRETLSRLSKTSL